MVNAKGEWIHKMINILIRGGFYFSFQKGGIFLIFRIAVHFTFYISPLHIWQVPPGTKYFKLVRASGIQFSSPSRHPRHRYRFIYSAQSLNFSQYPPLPTSPQVSKAYHFLPRQIYFWYICLFWFRLLSSYSAHPETVPCSPQSPSLLTWLNLG